MDVHLYTLINLNLSIWINTWESDSLSNRVSRQLSRRKPKPHSPDLKPAQVRSLTKDYQHHGAYPRQNSYYQRSLAQTGYSHGNKFTSPSIRNVPYARVIKNNTNRTPFKTKEGMRRTPCRANDSMHRTPYRTNESTHRTPYRASESAHKTPYRANESTHRTPYRATESAHGTHYGVYWSRRNYVRCNYCYERNHTSRNCRHGAPIRCDQCGDWGHKTKHHDESISSANYP